MSQYKSPIYSYALKQASFRSSFGRSKSFGGVVAGSRDQVNKSQVNRKNKNGKKPR